MNRITLTLTDDANSITYELLQVPFTEKQEMGGSKIVTLDGNVSTYRLWGKRLWTHKWAWMTEQEYLNLKGFYDRQWTSLKYPKMTCERLGVESLPVVLDISDRNIISDCGVVRDVEISLRETVNDNAVSI